MLPRDEQIILIESTYPIKSKKILYYNDSTFRRKLLKPTRVPTQEPYDPNKVFSTTSNGRVNNEESNAVEEKPNIVDYPIEAQTKDAAYDKSNINDKFEDEDIYNEDVDGKFEDEEDDDEFDDEFEEEKDYDRFDDEEDEFEDENISDKLKNNEK